MGDAPPYQLGQISGTRKQISDLVESAMEPEVQPTARFAFLTTLMFEVLLDIRELLLLLNTQAGAAQSHEGILVPPSKGIIL